MVNDSVPGAPQIPGWSLCRDWGCLALTSGKPWLVRIAVVSTRWIAAKLVSALGGGRGISRVSQVRGSHCVFTPQIMTFVDEVCEVSLKECGL